MRSETPWNLLGFEAGKTNFYCRSLKRCLKDTDLSAFVNQVVPEEAAFGSKESGEAEEVL